MALGSENILPYQRQQQQAHKMLDTRALYQQQHHQQRLIAPAPTMARSYSTTATAPYTKPTLPSSYTGTTLDSDNPSVVRRNARERNRVKTVNNGFCTLRQHIPQAIVADLSNGRRGIGPGASKKLSKVDTLRMAVEYIRRLKNVIEEVDSGSDASSVSSYNSCGSSTSSSPPPSMTMAAADNSFYQMPQQQYYPMSYAGSFPSQEQSTMISPAASTSSSTYSSNSYYHSSTPNYSQGEENSAPVQLKFEPTFDEYPSASNEDEELLDYISLWQEDM